MRTNVANSYRAQPHEGGPANPHQKPLEELERAVATCLLWENTFYESGAEIAARIKQLCDQVPNEQIVELAIKARNDYKLRHVPLYLLTQLARKRAAGYWRSFPSIVKRPDEMGELLSLYWRENRKRVSGHETPVFQQAPLPAQFKKGLAATFPQFSAHSLAKWDRPVEVKLKDVMFLTHPRPKDIQQANTWAALAEQKLPPADTWEVALSAGQDKRATWERLLRDEKLGYMALLMNLRNMSEANVEPRLVENALLNGAKDSMALPFRFVSAYKHAPQYASALSEAMELAVTGSLPGETAIVLDVSGSMEEAISKKSQLTRWEAAAALAVLIRGLSRNCRVFSYDSNCREVPNVRGLSLISEIRTRVGGGTNTRFALEKVHQHMPHAHRVILVTDEQAHDGIYPLWAEYGYIINVAPYKPSLETTGGWVRINGWSERVVDWMQLHEGGTIGDNHNE